MSSATIVGTAHNLSERVPTPDCQICIVCHTPHNTNVDKLVPIWNQNINRNEVHVVQHRHFVPQQPSRRRQAQFTLNKFCNLFNVCLYVYTYI